MDKYRWKVVIKEECMQAGVYEPSCDRFLDLLANIMSIHQDFSKKYDETTDFNVKHVCSIRMEALSKTALAYWRELRLTPKEYREFMNKGAETTKRKDDVLEALEKFENE